MNNILRDNKIYWINNEKKAVKVIQYALNKGYKLNRYDNHIATTNMKSEIVKEYCTNYSKSLTQIAKNLSKKYNMNISESTIRKYARKKLGSNKINRKDKSAKKLYNKKKNISQKYKK